MLDEVVEILGWVAKILPAILGLREALKTNDPAQEYAAQVELLRQMRLQLKAAERAEVVSTIASRPTVFLNNPSFVSDPEPLPNPPMTDDDPYGTD